MTGNITLTVYLNKERHKKYEEDKAKFNTIARDALKDALDIATTVIEEDLLEVAQKEIENEKKEKEQMKDLIEEKPIADEIIDEAPPIPATGEKKKRLFGLFKKNG